MRFVLASASPTRLRVLRAAGFDPEVLVSGVDEAMDTDDHDELALVLAERKADAVAVGCTDAIVLGCDSVVVADGKILGKPTSAAEAAAWWRTFRRTRVMVATGHALVDTRSGARASLVDSAMVRFGDPTDAEIDRYVATDEALGAAGGFRLDGRAAAFIGGVQGDPGTVHGVSIFVLRFLLHDIGVEITDLWAPA
jgi:septum formation protein